MKTINLRVLSGLFFLLYILIEPISAISQNGNMQRDLMVIEAVVTEIVSSELGENKGLSSKKAKASYIEGRGILIKIPAPNIHVFGKGAISIVSDDKDKDKIVISTKSVQVSNEDAEEKESTSIAKIEKAMRTFLVNYGDLARELPANEKIILLFKKQRRNSYRLYTGNTISLGSAQSSNADESINQFSTEVLKSDITDFKTGKLTEEEFWDKVIKKKISTTDSEKDKLEFNVLARIFESRLTHQKDEIEEENDNIIIVGLNNFNKVEYEVVSGLGVIYSLNLRTSFAAPSVFIKGFNREEAQEKIEEVVEQSEELQEEGDERVEDMATDLIENIKEDMIVYGRTLHSLVKDEMLIVEMHLSKCYNCELPGTYQLAVSKEVLENYEKRKIDLEEAVEKIVVKEKGRAKEKSNYDNFYFDWRE